METCVRSKEAATSTLFARLLDFYGEVCYNVMIGLVQSGELLIFLDAGGKFRVILKIFGVFGKFGGMMTCLSD